MSPFVAIAATAITILLFKIIPRLWKFVKFCFAVNKLPGPGLYPLPVFSLKVAKIKPEDRMEWFSNLYKKFESGIMMNTLSTDEVMVHIQKPHHLEVVFPSNENITKSFVYDDLGPWLGKALLTSTGQKWFHQRKIFTPAFHFGVVDQFYETMSEKAEVLNQVIEEKVKENPEKPIEFFSLAIRCALDVICETAMGVNMNVQRNYDTDYINALHKFADISIRRLNYPWLKWNWIFYKTKWGAEYKSTVDIMTDFTLQILKKKQQSRKTSSNDIAKEKEDQNEIGKRKKKAFLDLLLDVNEKETIPMTETELREHVDTFMFAGHDTTAAAINWAIFNLGNNPEIQEKVHQELDDVFGNSKEAATMNEIAELKYLDRVIKETLRLHPSVPGVGRLLTEDIELDGYVIPKGCNLSLSIFNLHRNPEIWPDPLKFDPDRFLPDDCRKRHPYAYVPFSAGPRNCIGQKFAVAEQKIVLTALLRKWKVKCVKSPTEMKLRSTLILRPFDGNPVYFTPK